MSNQMTSLIPLDTMLPAQVDHQVQHQLEKHIAQMQLIERAAQQAMDEISLLHAYGMFKVTSTLMSADLLMRAAYGLQLTPAEEEALHAFKQEYLVRMQEINNHAGAKIMDILDGMPHLDEPSGMGGLLQRLMRR